MCKARITKITLGRLYNLGNYEHVRYELTAEVPEGESAQKTVIGLERILSGLKRPSCKSQSEIERAELEVERMQTMPVAEWEQRYGGAEGTPTEVIRRYQEQLDEAIAKRTKALAIAERARALFDDLGGAAEWKDAKVDWQDDDDDWV